jgi:hypothetical protein
VLGAPSSAGPVTRPLGTPPLDAEGVVLGAEGLVDVEGVVELGCCTVFGLDGLTVGDCVGVVGAGPAGAADPAEPPEPPDEDDCACACSIRSQLSNAMPPSVKTSISTNRSNLLLAIVLSFESVFLLSVFLLSIIEREVRSTPAAPGATDRRSVFAKIIPLQLLNVRGLAAFRVAWAFLASKQTEAKLIVGKPN